MQAAEVNVLITAQSGKDLTGSTSRNLRVQGPADTGPRDLPMNIGVPNTDATRSTLATDFPVGGNYCIQLRVQFADGRLLVSPEKILFIGRSF